jgi:hypothetical protein
MPKVSVKPRRARLAGGGRRKESGSTPATNLLGLAGVVTLTVLGYHGAQFDVRQTAYASREDCLQDWGTEESCSRAPGNQGSVYYGPRYYWDPDKGKPMVVNGDGSEHVATDARVGGYGSAYGRTAVVGSFSRGGFGGIGHGFSSGRGG